MNEIRPKFTSDEIENRKEIATADARPKVETNKYNKLALWQLTGPVFDILVSAHTDECHDEFCFHFFFVYDLLLYSSIAFFSDSLSSQKIHFGFGV